MLQLDALASLVVILLVELKADEVALLFYTSNGGGASHTMQSTLPSGILFIPSRQSSLYILFSSIILYIICSLLFLHRHPRFRVIQCGEHFTVNLPHQVRVPAIEFAYHLQRTEHELLQWGKLDLLYEEALAEVGATR